MRITTRRRPGPRRHTRKLSGYAVTKGSVQFGIDEPLPDVLIRSLIAARLRELGLDE